eukprot:gnl/MRDRNA2_/MRDRNA2_51725_c0_seq1.p1 gnl/MRDRNA2_/MRDRNA2_51725_c0~~gnl/MRDRNA2_/MRDRNA2_51725_c0_seq1.p1  ORF type:complete len:311 (+),score=40.74 gnl/MRDRNA2_/MRDRNA2_51725_c0_seq1:83-1015(+)
MHQSRSQGLRSVGVPQASTAVPKRRYRFTLGDTDRHQCKSPTLLVGSSGSSTVALCSPLTDRNGSVQADERFCVEPPRLEFGAWSEKSSQEAAKNIPFRIFVARWQMAIIQACMLLTERVQTLTRRQKDGFYNGEQGGMLQDLAFHVAAAGYYILKWSSLLSIDGSFEPLKPIRCVDSEEAIATLRSVLSRLTVSASAVHTRLLELHNQAEIGSGREFEVQRYGLTVDELYSIVIHLEQVVHQANQLINMSRFARSRTTPNLHGSQAKKDCLPGSNNPILDTKETYWHVSNQNSDCKIHKQMHETFVSFV